MEDIYPLSGKGPTYDGRLKPDVTAPGAVVVSSYNSYAGSHYVKPEDKVTEVSDENGGRKYSWGVLSGTSMATPVVTGTVALWLQADNTLTVDDVLDVIQATAVRDVYTGGEASGVFGHGKIDARAGLEYLVRSTGISSNALAGVKCTYNNGKLIVSSNPGVSRVALYRIDGTLVSTVEVHGGEAVIDVPRCGVYLVKVITGSGQQTLKLAL